jgi:hypothetical protein
MLPLLRSPGLVALSALLLCACGQTAVPKENPFPDASSSTTTSASTGGGGGEGGAGGAGGAGATTSSTGGSGGGSTTGSGGSGTGGGACGPSDASIVQQGVGASPAVLLKGTVVTPDQVFAGEVLLTGDTITCVAPTCAAPAGASIVDTKGIIFPGLIDAHNHILFDIFDEDDWAPTQSYTNHNQWTSDLRYKAMVDCKQYLNGESNSPYFGCEMDKYGELKGLIAGTTSILGAAIPTNSACYGSLARTIDQKPNDLLSDKVQTAVAVPSDGDSVCGNITTNKTDAYVVHVAEGVDMTALKEFGKVGTCTTQPECLYAPETTVVHGLALGDAELQIMADKGMSLVWSPRSNSFLYSNGQITELATAKVKLALEKGINVALGPDWSIGGSQNLLDELRFAEQVNQALWDGVIPHATLVKMVTINAAKALGLAAQLGSLEVGKKADVMVIGGDAANPYDALLAATPADVRLVMVGGVALYGDKQLQPLGPAAPGCEDLDVCCRGKFVCVAEAGGAADKLDQTLAVIETNLSTAMKDCDAMNGGKYTFSPLAPLVKCQ